MENNTEFEIEHEVLFDEYYEEALYSGLFEED